MGGLVAACLVASFCLGCAHRPRMDLTQVPADRLASLMRENQAKLLDLEGRARISLLVDGIRQTVRASVLYKAPDLLKVEVMGALGGSALTAVSRQGSLEVYLPEAKQLIVDQASGDVLSRLTGVELGPYDPKHVFLGTVAFSDTEMDIERRGDRYLAVFQEDGLIRRVWIEGDRYMPVEEEIYDACGDLLLRRRMTKYERIGGARLPRRIEILDGRNWIRIEFLHRRANRGIREKRFRIKVPSGVERIVVER